MEGAFVTSALVLLISLACSDLVRGNGCTRLSRDQPRGTVINMCEERTWKIAGIMYFSGSNTEMGQASRCRCTIRALTEAAKVSAISSAVTSPEFSTCNAMIRIQGSSTGILTCTNRQNFSMIMNSSVVTMDLSQRGRNEFDFCVYMAYMYHSTEIYYNATCGSRAEEDTGNSTQEPLTFTTAWMTTSSLDSSVSPSLSTTRAPTGTTPCECRCETLQDLDTASGELPAALVGVAGVGWIIATAVTAALITVCLRHRASERARNARPGADNSAYAELSDVTRVDPRSDPNYEVLERNRQ